jgi:Spy/CpxP family protein refolding chaperone
MKRFVATTGILLATIAASVVVAPAQPQQQPPLQNEQRQPPPPHDPLGDFLFPPDLIMSHQRELALTDEQKTFMRGEIQRTTTRFNELQWQLQDAMESLQQTMKANAVNEQLALQQLDKVLESEREIKRMHMELAIRLKNKLTPDQQTKLQTMRQGMRPPRQGGPGRDGPGMGPHRRPGGPGGPGQGPGGPGGPGGGGPGGGGPGGPPQRPNF